jgi:hypothetical protein
MQKFSDPQEVILYCESRFRAILCAVEKAEGEHEDWLGRGLREEVVRLDLPVNRNEISFDLVLISNFQ